MTEQRSGPMGLGTSGGLLVLGALGLLAWRTVRSELDGVLRSLPARGHSPLTRPIAVLLVVVPLVLLGCVAGAMWPRARATQRTLATRASFLMLPADDFDPSEDAVLRAAAQLSRVRRALLGWLDTRASAVRVRMDSGPDGRLLCRIEVAGRARSVVRSAITSMGAVELREETAAAGDASS